MSKSATAKRGLVILPNNHATLADCELCGIADRMAIPFDTFTTDDRWVCGNCASHEWGAETVARLHALPQDEPKAAPTGRTASDWRMSVANWGFGESKASLDDAELLRVTIRAGLSPDLATVIGQEVLRRYAAQSPELSF